MNIFPSIDTSVCSTSVRKFNDRIAKYPNTVYCWPFPLTCKFAHQRFCETEGIKNAVSVSELRNREFGDRYGLRITDGPMEGLLSRAVIILDETGTLYTRQVAEIGEEPDYDAAFTALHEIQANTVFLPAKRNSQTGPPRRYLRTL